MQTAKSAAAAVKETATNIAASAKSGKDKTTAVVEEKMERMKANDPIEKEMATQRKEEKFQQAEMYKQQVREENAVARTRAGGVTGGTPAGIHGHQMPALPGHGTGQTEGGHVSEGVVSSHPVGINTGTGSTADKNPHIESGDAFSGHGIGTGGAAAKNPRAVSA